MLGRRKKTQISVYLDPETFQEVNIDTRGEPSISHEDCLHDIEMCAQ